MPRSESLLHDHAWAHAHAVMDSIAHNYDEPEQRELFALLYNAARATCESLLTQQDRIERRIAPSKN